jgi:hypothetical protein
MNKFKKLVFKWLFSQDVNGIWGELSDRGKKQVGTLFERSKEETEIISKTIVPDYTEIRYEQYHKFTKKLKEFTIRIWKNPDDVCLTLLFKEIVNSQVRTYDPYSTKLHTKLVYPSPNAPYYINIIDFVGKIIIIDSIDWICTFNSSYTILQNQYYEELIYDNMPAKDRFDVYNQIKAQLKETLDINKTV